jgi:hypothetical protein
VLWDGHVQQAVQRLRGAGGQAAAALQRAGGGKGSQRCGAQRGGPRAREQVANHAHGSDAVRAERGAREQQQLSGAVAVGFAAQRVALKGLRVGKNRAWGKCGWRKCRWGKLGVH